MAETKNLMPILYEEITFQRKAAYIIKAELSRLLTSSEIQKLHAAKSRMEQKTSIHIHRIEILPKAILIHYSPTKTRKFIAIITAITIIAAAIGLPITAWFLTAKPAVGPLGLPYWTWIGVGISIPILALIGLVLVTKRK